MCNLLLICVYIHLIGSDSTGFYGCHVVIFIWITLLQNYIVICKVHDCNILLQIYIYIYIYIYIQTTQEIFFAPFWLDMCNIYDFFLLNWSRDSKVYFFFRQKCKIRHEYSKEFRVNRCFSYFLWHFSSKN